MQFQPQNMANSGEAAIVAPWELLLWRAWALVMWLLLWQNSSRDVICADFSSLLSTASDVINIAVAKLLRAVDQGPARGDRRGTDLRQVWQCIFSSSFEARLPSTYRWGYQVL